MGRISIALCTYNGCRYVLEQLLSIEAQSRLPDELVIVDDGSTDNTVDIVRSWARHSSIDCRIILNPIRLGTTRNFEKAIRASAGEVVVLADQDDVWRSDKLALTENAFSRHPTAAVVFSDAIVTDEHLSSLGYGLWESVGCDAATRDALADGRAWQVLLQRNVVTGATMAVRAEHARDAGPFPQSWLHDSWMCFWASLNALPVIGLGDRLIWYRQHGGNQIGARRRGRWRRFRELRESGGGRGSLMLDRYIDLLQRCKERATDAPGLADIVGTMLPHFKARNGLASSRMRRIVPVLREVLTGRYAQYSNGLDSVLRDLLL